MTEDDAVSRDPGVCPDLDPQGARQVRIFEIINRKGLHARATAKLVQCIDGFDASITVSRCGETVGGSSIMGILTLGAGPGMTITVTASGSEAAQAMEAIATLIASRFGEDE
ncbi:MAG: HPr family phosphocarrier protein [Beijerinckiaceae bacterium]|nr:HPr family phosphocarrier protein [Beijerinckiaceae bacterium]MCI0736697.1 HPr family phosphocarrier protein [Beijerinckiaceae bacterium]